MANFKCYDYLCDTCHEKTEWLVNTSDPAWDAAKDCMKCGRGKCRRAPSAPPVQKASYVDGTKRKGMEDLKKIADLEVIKANTPPEKRGEIAKEIHERRKLK